MSNPKSAEFARAVERAQAVLQPGDRLHILTCGSNNGGTITMVGWSASFPGFIVSRSRDGDEYHPYNIVSRNGRPITFRDHQVSGEF